MKLAQLASCRACPRLVQHHAEVASQYPDYHARPVGSWGDKRYRVLVVGLAPGLHGAARTGKAFVGDASGEFLFEGLYDNGFATDPDPQQASLINLRLTNVVKCLPPGNAPIASEINQCAGFLLQELTHLLRPQARQARVVLALGGVAHRAVCRTLQIPAGTFQHNGTVALGSRHTLVSSFHPSRLNVNTGRLTRPMFDKVLRNVRSLLSGRDIASSTAP
ncbi:MAG: uracil-DNA glycosylase [Pseudomonadaceae bacterium]|nr:uracil-DNA glycosylase [Pseudomonadaceae bacterium]